MKKMKRHLLGFSLFLTTFAAGFLIAPIHFTKYATGQAASGPFATYQSTYFIKVAVGGFGSFDTAEETRAIFAGRVQLFSEYVLEQEILELDENRAVIWIRTEHFGHGFCIIRKGKLNIFHMCSTSLGHVIEFEKQRFPEN